MKQVGPRNQSYPILKTKPNVTEYSETFYVSHSSLLGYKISSNTNH